MNGDERDIYWLHRLYLRDGCRRYFDVGGNVFDHPLITEGVRRAEVTVAEILQAGFIIATPFAIWVCWTLAAIEVQLKRIADALDKEQE